MVRGRERGGMGCAVLRDLLFDVILVEQFLHLLSLLLGFFELGSEGGGVS